MYVCLVCVATNNLPCAKCHVVTSLQRDRATPFPPTRLSGLAGRTQDTTQMHNK